MANPLARVVMNSVAQKSGRVGKNSSKSNESNNTANLGRKEKQILTSLLNSKGKTATKSSSSYNKNTYGRSSNVGSVAENTMKTLDSLTSASSNISPAKDRSRECVVDKSRPNLKSLCSLDNITLGKTNVKKSNTNTDNSTSKRKVDNKDLINKLNLDELVKGKNTNTNSLVKREVKASKNNVGSMTTLSDLAGNKTKNSSKEDKSTNTTVKNSYVKSSVINNLEAYVPKVTLESIGKKGSLF